MNPSKEFSSASRDWGDLPNELTCAIASYLPENAIATSAKLVNKHYASCLSEFRVVRLSQPLPLWTQRHFGSYVEALAFQPWPSRDFVVHWGRPEPWRCLTLPQRRRLLSLAASSGDTGSLEAALAHCGCSVEASVVMSAALAGHVSACEKLVSQDPPNLTHQLFSIAAEAGQLEVCRWYWQRREELQQGPFTAGADMQLREACVAACRGGREDVLSWLEQQLEQQPHQAQQQQELTPLEMADAAAAAGSAMGHDANMALAAAEGGHVALFSARWAAEITGAQWRFVLKLACHAAVGCDLPGLQQLASFYYDPSLGIQWVRNSFMARCAAASPTPDWRDKVDWATQQPDPAGVPHGPEAPQGPAAGVPQEPDEVDATQAMAPYSAQATQLLSGVAQAAFRVAAGFPDWHLRLQHLRSRGLPLLDVARMAEQAATAGNTAALTWLLKQPKGQGLAASDALGCATAEAGHVPVLECLRARGFVFDVWHAIAAATWGRSEALAWMAAVVAEGDASEWSAAWQRAAAAGVDLLTLRLLHEQRGAAVDLASVAGGGSVEAVEWVYGLLEQEQAAGAAGGSAAGASTGRATGATGAGAGAYACFAAPSPVSLEALWAAAEAGNWATASWLLLRQRQRGTDCCHELRAFFARKAVASHLRRPGVAARRWLEGELERAAAERGSGE